MREIKFRGQTKETGELSWVYGSVYYWKKYGKLFPIIGEGVQNGSVQGSIVALESVGQFAVVILGGVDLFEGDIFHLGDINIKYVVVWHDTGLKGKQIGSSSYVGLTQWKDNIVIIGNQTDNPELLITKEK